MVIPWGCIIFKPSLGSTFEGINHSNWNILSGPSGSLLFFVTGGRKMSCCTIWHRTTRKMSSTEKKWIIPTLNISNRWNIVKIIIPRVIEGSKNLDFTVPSLIYQKCSLQPFTRIDPVIQQICLFIRNSCLIKILYSLLTSKSNIHTLIPFNKNDLKPDFQVLKVAKNKRSRPKRVIFRYFLIFFSILPCFNIWHIIYCQIRNFERNLIIVTIFWSELAS